MDFHDFKTVKNEYRPSAVWYLCGAPTAEEIDSELKRFAEKGIGRIYLKPTGQLSVRYMSRDYFELVRTAARRSAHYGIELWLYDDNGKSSGFCGGEITSVPEYRAAGLAAVSAADVRKSDNVICENGAGSIIAEKKDGRADICAEEAADCFAEHFYGALRGECQRFLGIEISGMVSNPRIDEYLPYSREVYEKFSESSGKAAVCLFREDTDGRNCRRKYLSEITAAAKNGFIEKSAAECKKSGLRFSLLPGGRLLENQSVYMMSELPCIEFDCTAPDFTAVKRLTSCGEIFGIRTAVSIKAPRLAAASDRKSAAALCIMLGADEIRYDGTPFSFADGEKYENSRFHLSLLGENALSEYIARLARIKAETRCAADVCLVFPTEYLRGLSENEYKEAYAEIEKITKKLLHRGADFHIIDEDLLTPECFAADGLSVDGNVYRTALLPDVPCLAQLDLPDYFVAAEDFSPDGGAVAASGTDAPVVNRTDGESMFTFVYSPHGGAVEVKYGGELYLADASEGEVYLLSSDENGCVKLIADAGAVTVFTCGKTMYADDAPITADGALLKEIHESVGLPHELAEACGNILPLKEVNACFGKKALRNDNIDNLREKFYALSNGEHIKLKYPFEADLSAAGDIAAYIECGGSMDTVLLNGKDVRLTNAGKGFWRADISGMLANGKNTFALEYTKNSAYPSGVQYASGSPAGLSPIYLEGDFDTDGKGIVSCELHSGDVSTSMPHCFGKLTYVLRLPSEIPRGTLLAAEGSFDAAVIRIGRREKVFFSSPARIELFGLDTDCTAEIEICCTARNLFAGSGEQPLPFGIKRVFTEQI